MSKNYFAGIDDVFNAFEEMAKQVKKCIIACGDDEYLQRIQAPVPVVYYGFGQFRLFWQRPPGAGRQTASSCWSRAVWRPVPLQHALRP